VVSEDNSYMRIWMFIGNDLTEEGEWPERMSCAPSVAFVSFADAKKWLSEFKCSGHLLAYVPNESAFDRAIKSNNIPKKFQNTRYRQVWSSTPECMHVFDGEIDIVTDIDTTIYEF